MSDVRPLHLSPGVRPRIPTNYRIWLGPLQPSGEEELVFISGRRAISVRGRKLSAFRHWVLPLLDGTHTLDDLKVRAEAHFLPAEVEQFIALLARHGLLDPDPVAEHWDSTPEEQYNFLHEIGLSPSRAHSRLRDATVAVFGLGGSGAYAALAIASARVGRVCCIDDKPVDEGDLYLAPVLTMSDIGADRATSVGKQIEQMGGSVSVLRPEEVIGSNERQTDRAMADFDFVICGAGERSRHFLEKVNQACIRLHTPWTSCFLGGIEGILGPTVLPGKTACYACYRMRSLACAPDVSTARMLETALLETDHDDSVRPENLTFGAGMIGNMAALEAFKAITGAGDYFAAGRVLVIDFLNGRWEHHAVLRKPWCQTCFPDAPSDTAGS